MKREGRVLVIGFFLILFVAALISGSAAQAAPRGAPLFAPVGTGFNYQGYLEEGGVPADGDYDLRFSLWDDPDTGSQVGSDVTKSGVSVADGLFTVELDFGAVFDGTALWLEVEAKASGDPDYSTLSPRQALTAVPYAHYALNIPDHDHWGESWTGSGDGLTLTSSDGSAILGHASGIHEAGVVGTTDWHGIEPDWPPPAGVLGEATAFEGGAVGVLGIAPRYAIYGKTTSGGVAVSGILEAGGWAGVYGEGGDNGVLGSVSYEQGKGVRGYASSTIGYNHGVYGETESPDGRGGTFVSNSLTAGNGAALMTQNWLGAGTAIRSYTKEEIGPNEYFLDTIFRVENNGDVYADGTFYPGGADFAEMLPGSEELEPGDVLVVDTDGQLVRSTEAFQPTVVGVYSTQPGVVGGAVDGEDLEGKVPLAIVGVVPVKASAENGPIQPGDLLVASDTPGHAMRAGENPSIGTVIGKALEPLESGVGLIQLLALMQ